MSPSHDHAEVLRRACRGGSSERPRTREIASVVLLAAALGLACRGHFVKPHGDFYEFRETGHALLRGELPPTFKRAPVYPVLVAAAGDLLARLGTGETPADQRAAEWINALLLPTNAGLCLLIGLCWGDTRSRWAAWWFALLPIGLVCTAYTLVEPLLVATCLATILLAARGSRWAYVAAAVATMTRYDAAGLLLGVTVADGLGRGRWGRAVVRGLLAALPLFVWLGLTVATWETRSADHYLRQLGSAAELNVVWPFAVTLRDVFGPRSLSVPVWIAEWEAVLRGAVVVAILVGAAVGVLVLACRRSSGLVATAVLAAGYLAVHAVFPFRAGFDRFGYPAAVWLLLAVGAGSVPLAELGRRCIRSMGVRHALFVVVGLFSAMWLWGEGGRLISLWRLERYADNPLPAVAIAGTLLVWAAGARRGAPRTGRAAAALLMLAVATTQTRLALPMLGDGRERINDVLAARWIRDYTARDAGVLSPAPGLLRLYTPGSPAGRFVGLGEIKADRWPDILAECRRRHIRYIVWHDRVFEEQGAYYIRKWRLERFACLDQPERVVGVRVVRRFRERPNLWILEILDSADSALNQAATPSPARRRYVP